MSTTSTDSEDELENIMVKHKILKLMANLSEDNINSIGNWILNDCFMKDLKVLQKIKIKEEMLSKISLQLANEVPLSGTLPSEVIVEPSASQNDSSFNKTLHIDEFIYDDEMLDKMFKDGLLVKHICRDCKSLNIEHRSLISHSISKDDLSYIFNYLLPANLSCSQVLDIGSRLGAVLYGAFYFTKIPSIVGVEMCEDLCDIQNKMIKSFNLKKRVKVIHSDISNQADIIQSSHVIVMNNVFEYFMDLEKQKDMWRFLKSVIKSGTFLITVPSIEELLHTLDIYEDFIGWTEIIKPCQPNHEIYFDFSDANFSNIYMYKVQ